VSETRVKNKKWLLYQKNHKLKGLCDEVDIF
jgi:hypothetical protein